MKTKGFTLIEFIMVLVISAILAAILFPTFKAAQDRARARKVSAVTSAIH